METVAVAVAVAVMVERWAQSRQVLTVRVRGASAYGVPYDQKRNGMVPLS